MEFSDRPEIGECPKPILECVPNFSEGRSITIVHAIVDAISTVPNVKLMRWEMDADHNRSVVTMAGPPDAICEAAFNACAQSVEMIDMIHHEGVHPCIGATDVIPLIPISGMSWDQCLSLSGRLGKRIADELKVPVFLYGKAASSEGRAELASVRRGGQAGLRERMASDPKWRPDYGPSAPHETAGATAIGVRKPLVAFNIDLDTDDVSVARSIAAAIRESGRGLKGVKALGLYLRERGVAQVSMNLTDPDLTSLLAVYQTVRQMARNRNVSIKQSELIGMVHLQPALDAAAEFLKLPGLGPDQILDFRDI